MTISKDLFLAILAMDSYNRGYGAGIGGLVESGSLGPATIKTDSTLRLGLDVTRSAGFYAIAYTVGSGVEGIAAGTTATS